MEEVNELIKQRIQKRIDLSELDIDPYGKPFDVTHYAADILSEFGTHDKDSLEHSRQNATIAGRIVAMRNFGKAAFAHIQDSTGKIQVYFRKDILIERFKLLKKFDIGDIIGRADQAAQYGTPIPGLYLCGAGCHPGGDLTGAAGHNAAQEVLR